MAATRLITMHVGKGKTIAKSLKDRTDYAMNDEKTEAGEYISSYGCEPETADKEFLWSKQEYLRITGRVNKGDIIAYQIRQSFKPGEVTPKQANEVGYETAMRFTKGEHAFIVATHTDKEHIHNHVIFNSTTLDCTRKFRDFFFVGIALQRLSDLVCLEHGLSVIKPRKPGQREKYDAYEKREPLRGKICDSIDEVLLKNPGSMDEFWSLMKAQGYEIKTGKHIAVKGKEQKRFIRLDSLGIGYSLNEIESHIAGKGISKDNKTQGKKRWSRPKRDFDLLIDIQEKMKLGKGEGYAKWATVYNIKQMAQTLLFLQEHDIRDYETLASKSEDVSGKFHELSQSIKEAEKRLGEISVLRAHIINYAKTREEYVAYRKSGYSKIYFEEHREAITLHKAAKEAFSAIPDKKIPKVKELKAEYVNLLGKKKAAYAEYRKIKKEMQDYVTAKHNVDNFMKMQENKLPVHEQEKKMQKSKYSTK